VVCPSYGNNLFDSHSLGAVASFGQAGFATLAFFLVAVLCLGIVVAVTRDLNTKFVMRDVHNTQFVAELSPMWRGILEYVFIGRAAVKEAADLLGVNTAHYVVPDIQTTGIDPSFSRYKIRAGIFRAGILNQILKRKITGKSSGARNAADVYAHPQLSRWGVARVVYRKMKCPYASPS